MIYYLLAITALTILFWALDRAGLVKFCSVCAAAVSVWLIGTIGIYLNESWADPLATAILMGASIGAIAEKYGSRFGLVWKTLVVLIGFSASYLMVQKNFWLALALITVLAVATWSSLGQKRTVARNLFKDCC